MKRPTPRGLKVSGRLNTKPKRDVSESLDKALITAKEINRDLERD